MTADAKACVILLVCGASVISVVQTDTNKAVRIKFEDRHLRRFVPSGLETDTQRVSISSPLAGSMSVRNSVVMLLKVNSKSLLKVGQLYLPGTSKP